MMLAAMFGVDRDALICDLAETYHIYDYRAFPPHYIAILAVGLRDDSRIKMKISEQRLTLDQVLLASTYDKIAQLVWLNSKDGSEGRNRPKSVLLELTKEPKESEYKSMSPEEFEQIREQKLRRNEHG